MSGSGVKFRLLVVLFIYVFILISVLRINYAAAGKAEHASLNFNIEKQEIPSHQSNINLFTIGYKPSRTNYLSSKEPNLKGKENMTGKEQKPFNLVSSQLWHHLNTNFETSDYNNSYIDNTDYDYNYNYAEPVLPPNADKINNVDLLNALSSYFIPKTGSKDLTTNHSELKAVNPFQAFQNITKKLNLSDSSPFFDPYFFLSVNNKSNKIASMDIPSVPITQSKYPPWENLTEDQRNFFLNMTLGSPQRHSIRVSTGLTLYYGILLLVGIPGNGLTCLIILTNSYMRTAPNIFLFNIAFADLITLIMGKTLEIRFYMFI
jgi:hypothetical protein